MRTLRRSSAAALCAALVVAAGCKDRQTIRIDGSTSATFAKRDTTQTLGAGDIRIATTDSALELSLIGDSLVAGFGASARAKIKNATDTSKVNGTGFGANIEKLVKSTVAGALDHQMEVPLSEISDVRYENGLLVFYDRKGGRMHIMERDKGKDRPSQFTESDAQAFIKAFKSKTTKA
jgi:hypothetical protein